MMSFLKKTTDLMSQTMHMKAKASNIFHSFGSFRLHQTSVSSGILALTFQRKMQEPP